MNELIIIKWWKLSEVIDNDEREGKGNDKERRKTNGYQYEVKVVGNGFYR